MSRLAAITLSQLALLGASGAARVEFDSGQALLALGASGEWAAGARSLRPSARVTYYAERNEAFSDGAGMTTTPRPPRSVSSASGRSWATRSTWAV